MKTNEAIRIVMKEKEIGVNQMADRLGKSPRLVSERLSQENISIAKLLEMLRVLDYKIAIVPRNTKLPKGGYIIGEVDKSAEIDLDVLLSDEEPIKTGKRIKLK